MDKFLKFIKNKWFLLGISFLSLIYLFFLGKIAQLVFTSYLETENMTTLTIMYVFVNFLFAVLMFFTRKQIPTIITAVLIPLESFVILIVGFGQWHIIIPPVAVSVVIFLACGVGESFKTVAGTLFLMMFVVGGLVYSVFLNFGISLRYVMVDQIYEEDQELDYSARSHDYLTSADGRYRLVTYTKERDGLVSIMWKKPIGTRSILSPPSEDPSGAGRCWLPLMKMRRLILVGRRIVFCI